MSISSLNRTFALALIPWACFGCGGSDAKTAPAPTAAVPGPSTTESPVTSPDRDLKSILESDKEDMDGNN